MDMNYWIVLLVTIVAFMGGALWYGPLFGNTWMKIHHWDKKLSEVEMKEAMKWIWKLLLTEFISTLMIMIALAFVITQSIEYSPMSIGFVVWIWFAFPIIISDIIWWRDKKEWLCTKISIMLWFRFITILWASYIYSLFL